MRITKLGAAALAASVTFGGAALAFAEEVMPADPTVEAEATTTTTGVDEAKPTTTTTTTTTEAEPTTTTTVEGGEDAGEDAAGEAKEHPDNHGKIVSQTAHDTPPGPGHGKAVSEVARSKNHGPAKAAKPKKTTTTTAAE